MVKEVVVVVIEIYPEIVDQGMTTTKKIVRRSWLLQVMMVVVVVALVEVVEEGTVWKELNDLNSMKTTKKKDTTTLVVTTKMIVTTTMVMGTDLDMMMDTAADTVNFTIPIQLVDEVAVDSDGEEVVGVAAVAVAIMIQVSIKAPPPKYRKVTNLLRMR